MRKRFAELLRERMRADYRVRLLTADIGFGVVDSIREELSEQCHDFGAAEQLMIGAAVGLALSGLQPVCYSITPFILCRPFEWLRTFVKHDRVPIKLVGVGRKDEYRAGVTHSAYDAVHIVRLLKPMEYFYPKQTNQEHTMMQFLDATGPAFLHLSKL